MKIIIITLVVLTISILLYAYSVTSSSNKQVLFDQNPSDNWGVSQKNWVINKLTPINIGGYATQGLIQSEQGGLRPQMSGNTITGLLASINPDTIDNAHNNNKAYNGRQRNELALRNAFPSAGDSMSFGINVSGAGNLDGKKSTNIFQIKQAGYTGQNDAFVRIGVKNGQFAVGINGADTKLTGIKVPPANGKPTSIQIQNNGSRQNVIINGKTVATMNMSKSQMKNANVKLGIENAGNKTKGTFSAKYSNIKLK